MFPAYVNNQVRLSQLQAYPRFKLVVVNLAKISKISSKPTYQSCQSEIYSLSFTNYSTSRKKYLLIVTTPGYLGKDIFTVSTHEQFPENPLCLRAALSVTYQKQVIPTKFLPIQLWWKMALIVRAKPGYISYGSKVKLLFTVIKAVLEFLSRIAPCRIAIQYCIFICKITEGLFFKSAQACLELSTRLKRMAAVESFL